MLICVCIYDVVNAFMVFLCILFYLVGLAIFMSYFLAFVFILLLSDFNVWCTVWHVSGASRPLSFVNKKLVSSDYNNINLPYNTAATDRVEFNDVTVTVSFIYMQTRSSDGQKLTKKLLTNSLTILWLLRTVAYLLTKLLVTHQWTVRRWISRNRLADGERRRAMRSEKRVIVHGCRLIWDSAGAHYLRAQSHRASWPE